MPSPRYVTDQDWEDYASTGGRYRLYRLCPCDDCGGTGKVDGFLIPGAATTTRCPGCRGEGRTRQLVANAETPEAVGVALVTLAREGEFEECPIGLLDSEGAVGENWLIRPWLPSARNITDAARTLGRHSHTTRERT